MRRYTRLTVMLSAGLFLLITAGCNPVNHEESDLGIPIQTDVWEYIDGDTWDFYGMAKDFGFERYDEPDGLDRVHVTANPYGDDLSVPGARRRDIVFLMPRYEQGNWMQFGDKDIHGIILENQMCANYFFFAYDSLDGCYRIKDTDEELYVPFDAIIITAYLLENFTTDEANPVKQLAALGIGRNERVLLDTNGMTIYSKTEVS